MRVCWFFFLGGPRWNPDIFANHQREQNGILISNKNLKVDKIGLKTGLRNLGLLFPSKSDQISSPPPRHYIFSSKFVVSTFCPYNSELEGFRLFFLLFQYSFIQIQIQFSCEIQLIQIFRLELSESILKQRWFGVPRSHDRIFARFFSYDSLVIFSVFFHIFICAVLFSQLVTTWKSSHIPIALQNQHQIQRLN